MDKGNYITNLFDNLKDDIEFDNDIIAITKLLIALLEIDPEDSINKWKYILKHYNIKKLSKDMDFTPVLKDYPTSLLCTIGIEHFLKLINKLKIEHQNYIYNNMFNIYMPDCGLCQALRKIIITGDYQKERSFVDAVIKSSLHYPMGIFDTADFLKRIINFHLNSNLKNISFLLELTDIPNNKKDQSLLKTLLIDYI